VKPQRCRSEEYFENSEERWRGAFGNFFAVPRAMLDSVGVKENRDNFRRNMKARTSERRPSRKYRRILGKRSFNVIPFEFQVYGSEANFKK